MNFEEKFFNKKDELKEKLFRLGYWIEEKFYLDSPRRLNKYVVNDKNPLFCYNEEDLRESKLKNCKIRELMKHVKVRLTKQLEPSSLYSNISDEEIYAAFLLRS